jgi:methyl-accepting chemotaxis protein
VADEVRSLAAKSAEAAKDTDGLISASIEKAALGSRLATETAGSLAAIVEGINQSASLVGEISLMSDKQSALIDEIDMGVRQVSTVIAWNGATAEESAASSQEMSAQADLLEGLIARFKVKGDDTTHGI